MVRLVLQIIILSAASVAVWFVTAVVIKILNCLNNEN
jgi:hypothetical protein